ncbi:MAG: hypothetical protein SFV23_07510 [Planctomycetaceae bacterium]|nr:hypothetical protein [Planctomycetaceae bacterium]
MRSFVDKKGESWPVEITLGTLLRVKHATGHDMLNIAAPVKGEQPLAVRLVREADVLAAVLTAVVQPYLRGKSVSDEEFADRLGGKAIDDGMVALLQEWADFFRQGNRLDQATAIETALKTIQKVQADQNEKAAKIDTTTLAESISGKTSGGAVASSVSTPAPSPSVNSTP